MFEDKLNSWEGFQKGNWAREINVREFIQKNYNEYIGDESFLSAPTERTKKLWNKVYNLMQEEQANNGVLSVDTDLICDITSHDAGYIDKDLEIIVGLQTDKPLKRAILPFGGIRIVEKALEENGCKLDDNIMEIFTKYRKTHNQGVYDVYTSDMKKARKSGIITGLPDSYGRGRIIGDYRRVALYGVDILMQDKNQQLQELELDNITEDIIRLREEITEQIHALKELKVMASKYGMDISNPAKDSKEAIQWTYFAYLAAIKEQNGAAMSIGRITTFLDIYIERDLKNNVITEEIAQEYMDDLVIKLRMVRFLRTKDYNDIFAGDPNWVTESIGGLVSGGNSLVTKNSFRILHTLYNLGPAPEPNLTVLWSNNLPDNFKKYCSKVSIETSAVQYENDDLMSEYYGDDYSIACCVSAMKTGKQMQFFGARCNVAKALLYAINRGKDEISGEQIAPITPEIHGEYLDYDDIIERLDNMFDFIARLYINTLNVIHYMHDKYSYERLQMALHDKDVHRTMACGIAGLSVLVDSLSAIKNAKVKCIKDERGIVTDFEVEGDFPCFGNDDDRADDIALKVQKMFMEKLRKHATYRNAEHTMSVLTITSNVVYGEKTGSTPDGRKKGVPFAPGANPMYNREKHGIIAANNSVAKLDYDESKDGISYTFSIVPNNIGNTLEEKKDNLKIILDSYFKSGGQHININIIDREVLIDAMEHPEKYPQLTIRVSGYAVNFVKLSKKHQLDIISRTFHN
ncbi:MAG: formate acetyltransferase [Clostridia bacterium]|jgi:formate C-acetyltransferase|nr:formate acetyltransferase [Clostridia bacterium]